MEIAVSDTGAGIPEEDLDRIYDPFFTTKPSGTGLGLSISLQIVREQGDGSTSETGLRGGVTFRLSFPVPLEGSWRVTTKVLIIDDEPSIARSLTRVLSDRGYEVRVGATASEGLAQLEAWRPQMVLLDSSFRTATGWICFRRSDGSSRRSR